MHSMPENGGTAKPPPDRRSSDGKAARLPGFWVRAASALFMVPLALAAVYMGNWWFAGFLFLIGVYATYEWNRMTAAGLHRLMAMNLLVVNGVSFAAMTILVLETSLAWAVLALIAGGAVAWLLVFGRQTGRRRRSAIWPATGLVYIGAAMLGLLWMRETHGEGVVFWLLILIWATDVGAYITGSLVGGPKLAPRFSPKKTWSGFVGGAALAALLSTLFGVWAGLGDPTWLIPVALLLAAWSQLGDIIESMIKRRYQVKDSGRLIPGHGGVLDRIDSLIFTVPLVVLGLAIFAGSGVLNG